MPPPIDLTGRRFGKLVVVGSGPDEFSASGKTRYRTWQVLCDCGGTETLRDHRLPYCPTHIARSDSVTACPACRYVRSCEACGKNFVSVQFKACCSDVCFIAHQRRKAVDHYYRKVQADPEHNKKKVAADRERAAVDPEFAERVKTWARNRSAKDSVRLKEDAEYRAYKNARARERWAQVREDQIAVRRARLQSKLSAMSEVELAEYQEQRREYAREYARRHRMDPEVRVRLSDNARKSALKWMESATPEELAAANAKRKARAAERRRLAALDALFGVEGALKDRIKANENGDSNGNE